MYLENNNIKVLRIFFKFFIEKLRKFKKKNQKNFQKIQKFFQKIQKNVLENSEIFTKSREYLKKLKIWKHQQFKCFELNKYIIV